MTGQPEPGHVEVLTRTPDGTLVRWTARYHDAGLDQSLGVLGIVGDNWHREVVDNPDGTSPTVFETTTGGHIDDQWCVFYGGDHPDSAAGVRVTDDLADAEEDAQWLIESGIAVRTVRYGPWQVREQCSGCGSVLDGADDCCEGRVAEVEAGRAVLEQRSASGPEDGP